MNNRRNLPLTCPTKHINHVLGPSASGDLRVGGPFLFKEYWGRPEATAEAFDEDGMFKTGDVVALEGDPPYFKVCARFSTRACAGAHTRVPTRSQEGPG